MIGYAMVINYICDNTMILDKFFSAVMICFMRGMPLIEIQSFTREFIDLETDHLFVLDNNNIPYSFRSIYSINSIEEIPAEHQET
jgi:hypothetical protein